MQISQLLKIHRPQKLHLSHAAERKGYAFNVSHILSNFQKDPFCQSFTFLNELELEKRDHYTPILLSDFLQSYFSLPCFWATPSMSPGWGNEVQCHGQREFWHFENRDLHGWTWLVSPCPTKAEQCDPRKRRHERGEAEISMVWISAPPSPSNMPVFLPWGYWEVQFRKRIIKYLLCSFPPFLQCSACLALHPGTAEGCLF